jgi:hypothetical protein
MYQITKQIFEIRLIYIINNKSKTVLQITRPTKLTNEVQQKIGDGVSLGLTYALAASAAGVTYQSLNSWMKRGRDSTSGKYFEFYKHIEQRNAEGAKTLLESLNAAAKAGDTQICMFILERRFAEDFGRRVYRKTSVVSENINANVEITVRKPIYLENKF